MPIRLLVLMAPSAQSGILGGQKCYYLSQNSFLGHIFQNVRYHFDRAQKRQHFWPPRWPRDGRDGSTGTQNTSTQCAWVVRIHIMCLGPLRDLYGTPRAPKRARFGPFGGPGGPWAAPGGLIWAQVPLVGPTGWAASISCARAPLETTTALLGPPKGPFWPR